MLPPRVKAILALCLALLANATPCPRIHIFGARETAARPGYGSTSEIISRMQARYKATTSEAIDYPACGGQSECGGMSYRESVYEGTRVMSSRVNRFHVQCPKTKLVFVGYSQGAQIMDNALCGGDDLGAGIVRENITILADAFKRIHAVVLLGNPRFVHGKFYNHGTCQSQGFAAREKSFGCAYGNLIQSICDAEDLFCCNGTSLEHHGLYARNYAEYISDFIHYMIHDEEPMEGGRYNGYDTLNLPSLDEDREQWRWFGKGSKR